MKDYWSACVGCSELNMNGDPSCDYMRNHGHRRPCPPGVKCTVKSGIVRKKSRGTKPYTWDTARARELYDQGMNDCEIARAIGTNAPNVRGWRKRSELKANAMSGSGKRVQHEC